MISKFHILFECEAHSEIRKSRNVFYKACLIIDRLSNFCPECGGELKLDTATKNFICKSCGLFASREKMDELRDKTFRDDGNDRKKYHDDYLDWWTSSKKDKQRM